MGRMLCVFLCAGVLLSGFLDYRPAFAAQEPAVIGGDKAVRFEQSTGFFHVAALCRTLTESTQQIPALNLPPEITEPAVCWYVKTVVTRGSGQVSPEVDGKLIISAHHVRFVPSNMQYEDLYVDLSPDQVQLDRQPGQPEALLRSSGLSLRFSLSDLCPLCEPGTLNPSAPVPALLDREFTLLYAGIQQFDSDWKQIDGLIEPRQADAQMSVRPALAAAEPEPPPAAPEPPPVTAATPSAPAVSDSVAAPPVVPPPTPAVVGVAPTVASASSTEPVAAAAPAPTLDRPHPGGQPARLGGAQALRFEQSPGFFHYIAFCKTAKESTAQTPPTKLPPDSMEYALCWYVTGSISRGSSVSPEAEGKLVISPRHVRFEPRDARFAKLYLELRPERAELRRDSAQDYAVLQGSDVVFRFQFTKMCLTCTPGTPAPSSVVPALMDEEFALLDKTIRHFYSGWKEIYRLSSGPRPESDSKEPGGTATSTGSRSGPVDSAPGATQPSRYYLSGYGRVDTEESAVTVPRWPAGPRIAPSSSSMGALRRSKGPNSTAIKEDCRTALGATSHSDSLTVLARLLPDR
jgi:hypothetical protein